MNYFKGNIGQQQNPEKGVKTICFCAESMKIIHPANPVFYQSYSSL